MPLGTFQLDEPVVRAMVTLLTSDLNTVINNLNNANNDAYDVPAVVQFLPYVPVPSSIEGGLPIVGVERLGIDFADDLQSTIDTIQEYAVIAICQHSDHQTLVWQLDRLIQALAYCIQQDRLKGTNLGSGGVMRNQGNVWSVNLDKVILGPLLGEQDPLAPEGPPRSYMSWTALVMQSRRRES